MDSPDNSMLKERSRAKMAVAFLLGFLLSSQWLLVGYLGSFGSPAVILTFVCWIAFAWHLNPRRGQRLTLMLLPTAVLLVAQLSQWLVHTEGYFGWSQTYGKAIFLCLVWLCDVLRRRCSELGSVTASRFFSLTEIGSLFTVVLVLTYGIPLPPGPSFVALGTLAFLFISSVAFLLSSASSPKRVEQSEDLAR